MQLTAPDDFQIMRCEDLAQEANTEKEKNGVRMKQAEVNLSARLSPNNWPIVVWRMSQRRWTILRKEMSSVLFCCMEK